MQNYALLYHIEPPNRRLSKKAKCCTITIGGLIAIAIFLAIGSMVALSTVCQPYTKEYLAHTDHDLDDVTISLGMLTTLWYSSATIKLSVENFATPNVDIYAVPSTSLKQHLYYNSDSKPWKYSNPVQFNTRKLGSAPFVYLFEGACFNYTFCLQNLGLNATAVAFIFDNHTEFSDFQNDGFGSSIQHHNLPIGTSDYECSTVDFVSPHDAYYFVTTEVTFDNSDSIDLLATEGNLTAYLELFNRSNYAKACTLNGASKSCDINFLELNNSTLNMFESYTIVASVPGKTSEEDSTAHFSVQVYKSLYVLMFPTAGLFLVVTATSILGILLCIKWKCHRH